ncbi:hypothetical protein D922_02234 [Enterococcus faecalis 06-MB-DW-09]|nr:hypothetical protein D922_02234 [Enterococcus faecalis 06-MB-DW-09]
MSELMKYLGGNELKQAQIRKVQSEAGIIENKASRLVLNETDRFLEFNLLNKAVIEEAFRRTKASSFRYHLAEQNPLAPNHPNLETLNPFNKTGSFKFRHWRPQDNPF